MSITARSQRTASTRRQTRNAASSQRRGARFRRNQPSQSGIQKMLGALTGGRGKRGSSQGGVLGKVTSSLRRSNR
jgi:hypothetical protein